MSNIVEVVLDSIRVSLMSPQRVIVLRRTDVEQYLPIWIGPFEADAITVALQEVETSRPMTHDLLKNIFASFGARILRVEIPTLKEDIFYGNIVAERDGKVVNIDSRPSDAIALAVRAHVPILVNEAVMEAAGIIPERDLQVEGPEPSAPEAPSVPPAGEDGRLDVFEEFLKKLDKGKEADEPPKN